MVSPAAGDDVSGGPDPGDLLRWVSEELAEKYALVHELVLGNGPERSLSAAPSAAIRDALGAPGAPGAAGAAAGGPAAGRGGSAGGGSLGGGGSSGSGTGKPRGLLKLLSGKSSSSRSC